MSNGCIYRTKDGECDLYAEGGKYTAFCELENCVGRKMANADRIRSMTDEELAHLLHTAEEHIFNGNLWNYEQWQTWLKSPADEVSE